MAFMMMMFTDCSSSSASARLLSFNSNRHKILNFRQSIPFQFGFSNPSFIRTTTTYTSSSSPTISGIRKRLFDGKTVAKEIREEVAVEISRMKEAIGVVPGLAVILVGDRKDSTTYVLNKKKACESVGINSYEVSLPEDSTEREVLKYISNYKVEGESSTTVW